MKVKITLKLNNSAKQNCHRLIVMGCNGYEFTSVHWAEITNVLGPENHFTGQRNENAAL